MGYVVRRSLASLAALLGLLLAVGVAGVAAGAPLWFPGALAAVVIGIQYVVNPLIIERLIPATVIHRVGGEYLGEPRLGGIVARRCRDAGVPLVKLGVVDDGMPNAFTFGRTRRDARIWVTRGLLERLDDRELDAVICHEIGHIKHRDFVVMTVAALVPMLLFYVFRVTAGAKDGAELAIVAFVGYVVTQFMVLSLSRAREYGADHWSCQCTGDGDALASALVKIAFGMGQVRAEEKAAVAARAMAAKNTGGHRVKYPSKEVRAERKVARVAAGRANRVRSARVMGIFDPGTADAMASAFADGLDGPRAVAALRWETLNPWGAALEKLRSHPLVAHRIAALENSGLPGAPRQWAVLRSTATLDQRQRRLIRSRFRGELAVAVGPWILVAALVAFGWPRHSVTLLGLALAAAGGGLLLKQLLRYPLHGFEAVDNITSLLERLDAGPVTGIPVELHGKVIGRATPGYVLSPDLVIEDRSGFVALRYLQPIPFVAAGFGAFKAPKYLGQEVVARGWYRRTPTPTVDVRELQAADNLRFQTWHWAANYIASAAVLTAGLVAAIIGATLR